MIVMFLKFTLGLRKFCKYFRFYFKSSIAKNRFNFALIYHYYILIYYFITNSEVNTELLSSYNFIWRSTSQQRIHTHTHVHIFILIYNPRILKYIEKWISRTTSDLDLPIKTDMNFPLSSKGDHFPISITAPTGNATVLKNGNKRMRALI